MGGSDRKRSVTIYDVAERADVSVSTVSRVMNGIPVDATMETRVKSAAAELNFVPNRSAVSLSRNRTQTVGLLVPDLANPTFLACMRGLEKSAAEAGYRVLVADTHEDPTVEVEMAQDLRRRCDALVLCAPRLQTEDLRSLLEGLDRVVLINRYDMTLPAPFVAADYRLGMIALASHLVALGHSRLLYLAGNPSSSQSLRLAGLDEIGREHPNVKIERVSAGVDTLSGYRSVESVIRSSATAVIAYNDLVAIGLLAGLSERGVSVPDELSVVGFDGIDLAPFISPPLTTVSVPAEDLGALAWRRVEALSMQRKPEPNLLLLPELVVRKTSAPPRA